MDNQDFCPKNISTESNVVENQVGGALYEPCEVFSHKSDFNDHKNELVNESSYCDNKKDNVSQKKVLIKTRRRRQYAKKFSCEMCSSKFISRSLLEIHKRVHTGEKPYECDKCNKRFSMKGNLIKHLKIHTGEKPFECEICEKRFGEKDSLRLHARSHTGEKPFECDVCKERFAWKRLIKNHMLTHTGEKPFECNMCDKSYREKRNLREHIRSHTGEKPLVCGMCQKRFSYVVSLKRHVESQCGGRPFECNICKKRLAHKASLEKHIRNHTGEKNFECNICKKRYFTRVTLKQHFIRTHTEDKVFECHLCKKRFSQKAKLTEHIHAHSPVKSFECNMCNAKFLERIVLLRHIQNHTRENPFKCHLCEKRFGLKSQRTRHIQTHKRNKSYMCGVCHKGFTSKTTFNRHKKTHIVNRSHVCDKCEENFKNQDDLQNHLTNVGPFGCDICLIEFARKCGLNKHKKNHTIDTSNTKKQQSFVKCSSKTDSAPAAFNLENSLNVKDSNESVAINPNVMNIGSGSEVVSDLHLESPNVKDTFHCDKCDENFKDQDDLQKHLTKFGPFRCSVCHIRFARKCGLNKHKKNHTIQTSNTKKQQSFVKCSSSPNVKDPFHCDKCDENFKDQDDLQNHLTKFGPFSCSVCHIRFARKCFLNKHKKKHNIQEKRYTVMKSTDTKKQQPFVKYSSDINRSHSAFNSEHLLNVEDSIENIGVTPNIVNMGSGREGDDIKFDSEMEVPVVKSSLGHCLDVDVKTDDIEFSDEFF